MIGKLPAKEYENTGGKKLNFAARFIFEIEKKRFERQFKRKNSKFFDAGTTGFLLGLFLFPIGVLLVYLFSRDQKLRKGALIGTGVAACILLLIVLFISSEGVVPA